jgi:hypothetical protein
MHAPGPFTSDGDIAAIGRGLLERTLPKPAWTHAAHLAAAAWILVYRPDLDAPRALPQAIRAYNESTGVANTDTGGYHATITLASIAAVRAFLAERPPEPFFASCNALVRSPLGDPGWLLAYWTRERLFSSAARRGWIEPDRKPMPF